MKNKNVAIIIPAYEPDNSLISLLEDLHDKDLYQLLL